MTGILTSKKALAALFAAALAALFLLPGNAWAAENDGATTQQTTSVVSLTVVSTNTTTYYDSFGAAVDAANAANSEVSIKFLAATSLDSGNRILGIYNKTPCDTYGTIDLNG